MTNDYRLRFYFIPPYDEFWFTTPNANYNNWFSISDVKTTTNSGTNAFVGIIFNNVVLFTEDDYAQFKDLQLINLTDLQLINLTQLFGAGNEPTKEQMDKLFEQYKNIKGGLT